MKIIGLGEVLWRISSQQHYLFSQTRQLEGQFGGAEFNVLGGLASLGYDTTLVTALPNNAIGQACLRNIKSYGIDTQHLVINNHRMGLYFCEPGYGLRPSQLTYDRTGSSFSQTEFLDYDWEKIFANADWFHVTGITPALGDMMYQLTLKAMTTAKRKGIKISFDPNYRQHLWPSFHDARTKLAPLVALADVCLGLEPIALAGETGRDFKDELGLTRPYLDYEKLLVALERLASSLELSSIAFTQREFDQQSFTVQGFLYRQGKLYQTPPQKIASLDRIGTGDAFAAGIIFGHPNLSN